MHAKNGPPEAEIGVESWSGMEWSGVDLDGVCMMMECNAVEWNAMDAFWSFCVILTLLVVLGSNSVVFGPKRKKVNFATRRRQIHPTNLKTYFY